MFDQLSSLSAAKTSWRIKVRVTRMWPSISNGSKGQSAGLKGYNMILLDDDNCHIHAFSYAKTWKAIEEKIEEGCLYVISNFYTKEALGSLKPVSSKYIINFSPSTTVDKLEEDYFMIPIHKFEFIDLGDLFGLVSSYTNTEFPDYSTVIGVIEEYERDIEIQTMYGDRHIVRFRLTDGRNSHMSEFSYAKWVQIATIPSSKIYLNLDFDVVHSMRQRLDEEGYIHTEKVQDSHAGESSAATYVVADLIETRYYLSNVKVSSVDESEKWWYTSYINCSEEVTKLEGTFRCPEFKKNTPVAAKRYKIMIVAGDGPESFNFVQ
ncbi:uncharacterized protein LOC108192575 [Daucus carota subsp. sativus]|uniref:uncharacterized protein LOC108192575 n=1 Tax=Daucus carota subsp. sativus TaxID=79200 RepID=UPI0007EF9228|nr:PREDICTED: uncharacterized protein LOC108192575 [Daucus carota subsp. sativus]